jgi:hypothetical protein
MGISREAINRLSDKDLNNTYFDAHYNISGIEHRISYYGEEFTPQLASELAESIEVLTVARAVGRDKCLDGGENSHKFLRGTREMVPDPKRVSRAFGRLLRNKRGV